MASVFHCGIIALLVTEAFDSIAGMFLMPVLPFHLRGDGLSPLQINLLTIVPMITGGIAQGLLGQASDRSGRKGILLAALVLEGFSYIAMALFYEPPQHLCLILAVQGAASGTDAVINAYISDNVVEDDRPLVMQVKTTVKSLATSAGAAIGSMLYTTLGWEWMSFCLSFGCVLQFVTGSLFWNQKGALTDLKSSSVADEAVAELEEEEEEEEGQQDSQTRGMREMLRHFCDPNIGPLILIGMVTMSGLMASFSVMPYLLSDLFHFNAAMYGRFMGCLCIALFGFTQISAWQVRVLGERACIAIANLLTAFCAGWLVVAAILKLNWGPWVFILGTSFQVPLNIAGACWLNRLAPEKIRGEINGVFGAACALCSAIVAPLCSWIYEKYWWLPCTATCLLSLLCTPLVFVPYCPPLTPDSEAPLIRKATSRISVNSRLKRSNTGSISVDVLNDMVNNQPMSAQHLVASHAKDAQNTLVEL